MERKIKRKRIAAAFVSGLSLLFAGAGVFSTASGQTTYVIHNKTFEYKEIPIFDPNSPNDGEVILKMRYAKAVIQNPNAWKTARAAHKSVEPVEIDLVYTKYPVDSGRWITPYHKLMDHRMRSLFHLDPSLRNAPIKWNLVAQTECVTSALAKEFFHGFVIRYKPQNAPPARPEPTTAEKKTDVPPLAQNDKPKGTDANPDPSKPKPGGKTNDKSAPGEKNPGGKTSGEKTVGGKESDGSLNPPDLTKNELKPTPTSGKELTAGEINPSGWNTDTENRPRPTLARRTQQRRPTKEGEEGEPVYTEGGVEHPDAIEKVFDTNMQMVREIIDGKFELNWQDSVVSKVLNSHPQWKELLVITDWTGSMYQFGAQVVAWHKQKINEKRIKHLILFNDGNDYHYFDSDHPKPVGKTGGIYYVDPQNIQDVIDLMKQVMESGDGGEIPENNIEAILAGQQKYAKDYRKIVMIADNGAAIRDVALLNEMKEPIHIILCGYYKYINPDYLTLAWKTGGSVHTINREVNFPQPEQPIKKSGLKIGKTKYVLSKETGRFEIKPRSSWFGLRNSDD